MLPGPMTGGYRAALDPLAGPGAFPLHRPRTMKERPPFHRAWASLRAPQGPMANHPPVGCRQRLAAGPRTVR